MLCCFSPALFRCTHPHSDARGRFLTIHLFPVNMGATTLNTMQQLRRKVQIFLKKLQDRVPVLSYEAYICMEPVVDRTTVYIYAFDGAGKVEGGCDIGIKATTGTIQASPVTTSRFFEFCRTSVPVMFGSDKVRAIWYEGVQPERGVWRIVAVRKK